MLIQPCIQRLPHGRGQEVFSQAGTNKERRADAVFNMPHHITDHVAKIIGARKRSIGDFYAALVLIGTKRADVCVATDGRGLHRANPTWVIPSL